MLTGAVSKGSKGNLFLKTPCFWNELYASLFVPLTGSFPRQMATANRQFGVGVSRGVALLNIRERGHC